MLQVLNRVSKWMSCVIFTTMFLTTLLQVVARYVFGSGFVWTEELARYLYVWLAFIGSAACYYENKHIVVDILTARVSGTWKMILGYISDLMVLAFNLVILVGGHRMVLANRTARAASIPALTINWVYLAIPLGAAAVILMAIPRLLNPRAQHTSSSVGGEA